MANSYANKQRPDKPYPEFPLFAHNNGQWSRKINGKLYSFGPWSDPNAALAKHNPLKEGIEPPQSYDGCRVGELINEFLCDKEDLLKIGKIQQVTFDSLEYVANLILEFIPKHRAVESLRPNDFRKLRNG